MITSKEVVEDNSTMELLEYIVKYVFEHDTGDVDTEFCMPEKVAGRCKSVPGTSDTGQCKLCLMEQFEKKWKEEEGRKYG